MTITWPKNGDLRLRDNSFEWERIAHGLYVRRSDLERKRAAEHQRKANSEYLESEREASKKGV